jgi:myo-inositol-1-phosphate synthase
LRRTGLWIIGARGSVATCVAYGLAGLRHGLLEPVGLATERAPLQRLDLVPLEGLILGGCDVSRRSLTESAGELVRTGVLSGDLIAASAAEASHFEARICTGFLDDADVGMPELDPSAAKLSAAPPRERIARVQEELRRFSEENELSRCVVCNLASTEVWRERRADWESLAALESALDRGVSQPASLLYAYAAIDAGHPYINFTPSVGASVSAMMQLAEQRGVPHCGRDGKTGETLLKSALAPMFVARGLRVLSWQGYNMLGNRDGEVLSDPLHRRSKLASKDEALRSILGDPQVHTHVGIDYVPSLNDWKTAMDFIHFEGFLGARMSLQLTWIGSDSALAAPLVIDLARLAEFAAERGEAGAMSQVACFFKAPMNCATHDFHAQFKALIDYARRHGAAQG